MKIITLTISLILLLSVQNYAQINESLTIVKSISSVSYTRAYDEAGKEFDKKSGVEIEIFTALPEGFYTGLVNGEGKYIERSPYCLQVGNLNPVVEGGSRGKLIPDNRIRYFVLTKSEWEKLKNGDEIRLFYGCPKPSDYKTLNPIAYLNKSLLDKPPQTKCRLPLEFAPKLQRLGLGYHVNRVEAHAFFNQRIDPKTNVLSLIFRGAENAEKLLPNYDREYLKELKNSPNNMPESIYSIDSMTLSIMNDLIFKQEIIYSEPLKTSSIRQYIKEFSEKWYLPAFWSYSQKMEKAELNCADFRIEIDLVDSKPRIVLTETKLNKNRNKRLKNKL